jgi:hypothetical protein
MSGTLFFVSRYRAIDANGDPMAGAKLEFFESGTSTPLDTYADVALTTPNANPVVADAGGLFGPIYFQARSYKVVLKTAAGATVWTVDPHTAIPPLEGSDVGIVNGRLSVASGDPFGESGLGSGTIYWVPYDGNRISLYYNSLWRTFTFAELSMAVGAADTLWDVYAYYTGSAVALEKVAWTSAGAGSSVRATALTKQDGVYVKTGDPTRRYLGTYRTQPLAQLVQDNVAERWVWNKYNRVRRRCFVADATDNWTYTTATFRQARASALNQVSLVCGLDDESEIDLQVLAHFANTNVPVNVAVGIGEDVTNAPFALSVGMYNSSQVANQNQPVTARMNTNPTAGYHFYAWLEFSVATGTTTWLGDGAVTYIRSGMSGWYEC